MTLLPRRVDDPRQKHYDALYDALNKAGVHLELDYAPLMYDGPNLTKPIQHPKGGYEKAVIRLPSCHRYHSGATNNIAVQVYEATTIEQAAALAIGGGQTHDLTAVRNACRTLGRRMGIASHDEAG